MIKTFVDIKNKNNFANNNSKNYHYEKDYFFYFTHTPLHCFLMGNRAGR